ncbi:SDR family NAD(P)-dependent oxidoreductase [Rhodococcus hoagii]|nr:SDR family NAD(P)-dependent oxidoreductase [Prescottella equi]
MSDTDYAPGSVVLLGGRSEIGLEVARRLAPGRVVVLAARRSGDLERETRTILDAGAKAVHCVEFDADRLGPSGGAVVDRRAARPHRGRCARVRGAGRPDPAEQDAGHALAVVHTDYVAQISVLTHLANLMRAHGSGQIVVFSSVAGARVRRANYVYGSAKAGLDGFASGLTDALHGSGVRVLLVRPGFVIGRMTEGMKPAPFSSTPQQVADAVAHGLRKGSERVWVPGLLRPVIFAMRLVPQFVWRRMPR